MSSRTSLRQFFLVRPPKLDAGAKKRTEWVLPRGAKLDGFPTDGCGPAPAWPSLPAMALGSMSRGPSRASPMRSRWAPLKSHDFGWLNGPRPRPNAGPRMRVLARKVGYSPENLPLLPLRIRPSRGPLCPTKLGAPGPASCVTRRQYSKPLIIRQDPSGRARPGIRDNSRRSPQNRRGPLHPGSLSKCHCLSATW